MSKQIFAFGGESHYSPENTMVAYWAALGSGADGIEVPVQLTKDKKLVCSRYPTLSKTCGDKRAVSNLTIADVRSLDAGLKFRSSELDELNQPTGTVGADTPWDGKSQRSVFHPELKDVLLELSRRTNFLIRIDCGKSSKASQRELAKLLVEELSKFGLLNAAIIGGSKSDLEQVRENSKKAVLALVVDTKETIAASVKKAKSLKASYAIVLAEKVLTAKGRPRKGVSQAFGKSLKAIVCSETMSPALTPSMIESCQGIAWVSGFLCPAVRDCADSLKGSSIIFEEHFQGKEIDERYWRVGYSKPNKDTKIWQDDGLHIKIRQGGEYSGAAALTAFSIRGDFDAQLDFVVTNPMQGTTFELAAIEVDPGYHHPKNTDLSRRNTNLTFDVHGAPPYASSERDENDGFRIGWNNGPAVTQFVKHQSQSSNIYNKYSRDVGDGSPENNEGKLRLVRCGSVFNAYYTDGNNSYWVLAGTANVPTLCDEVFLRIGAKHWPKRGKTPPKNSFQFNNFKIFQPAI